MAQLTVEERPAVDGVLPMRQDRDRQTPPQPPRPANRLRRIALPLGVGLLVLFGVICVNVWWQDAHYVSTDNAQVAGQLVPVGSMNAGRVAVIRTAIGAPVQQGDVLARVQLPTAVRTNQNGTPDLQFLPS